MAPVHFFMAKRKKKKSNFIDTDTKLAPSVHFCFPNQKPISMERSFPSTEVPFEKARGKAGHDS